MKRWMSLALATVIFVPAVVRAQPTKPMYISLPGPGNVQELAYYVAK
jgi:hypothetical protein